MKIFKFLLYAMTVISVAIIIAPMNLDFNYSMPISVIVGIILYLLADISANLK